MLAGGGVTSANAETVSAETGSSYVHGTKIVTL
ncbi:MAG: hypothetical protein WAX42_00320 [Lactococcus raffinolactis]